jgi:hypothetical protein
VCLSKALIVIAPVLMVWALLVFAKAICSGGSSGPASVK